MDKPTFSFGFTKRSEVKKLQSSAIKDSDQDKKEETDYLVSVEDNQIKSVKPVVEKAALVIPLIQQNRWLNARKPEDLETDDGDRHEKTAVKVAAVEQTGDKVTDTAVQEILSGTAQGRSLVTDANLTIPLLMKNKVPDGFETDDRLDVSLRPDEATEEDYESVPIEQFGLAVLRGMGWKESDGVGRTGKVVKPLVPVVRPKGLGLGADKSVLLQSSNNRHRRDGSSAPDDELTLKCGSHCMLLGGTHDGQYGTVLGIDEDNARVMISLAVGSSTTTVSQYAIKLVAKTEFDKFSKYLNKGKVDRYKEKHQKDVVDLASNSSPLLNGESEQASSRTKQRRARSESEDEHETKRHRHRKHKKTHSKEKHREHKEHRTKSSGKNDHHRDEEQQSDAATSQHHSSRHKHKHSDRSDKRQSSDTELRKQKCDLRDDGKSQSDTSSSFVWLRPNLRVRIIDGDYRHGKYYKTKVTVVDVISAESCICRTDDNQVLDDLRQSQLETVVPRDNATHVMIVSGKHHAQLAQLLNRDKDHCQAVVQLLSDRDVAVTLSYDAICEYAADVSVDSFDY